MKKKYSVKDLVTLDPNSKEAQELLTKKGKVEYVEHTFTRPSNVLRYFVAIVMIVLGFVSAHYYPEVTIGYKDITLTGLFSGGGVVMLTYQFLRDGIEFLLGVYKEFKKS